MTTRACRLGVAIVVAFSLSMAPRFARCEEPKDTAKTRTEASDSARAPAEAGDAVKARPETGDADKARVAETSDADKARALFREGRTLAANGHYDEACPKFEQSLEIEPGIGTRFNLADCLEHIGKLKKAQAMFLAVADAAHEKQQDDRERVARERAHALDEKLPRLGVDVKEMVDGLEVLVDGVAIDRTNWATGARIDPGAHDVEARAPHKKPWSLHVEVPAEPSKVTITVPKLEDEPKKVPVVAPAPEKKPPTKEPARHQVDKKPTTVRQTVKVFLLGGAGAGVLLAGTGLAIYKMSNDNAKDVCPTSVGCTPDDVQHHDGFLQDAALGRALGYAGLGLSGAALAGFAILSLSSPPNREAPQHAALTAAPLVGPGAWGASVRGRF